MLKSGYAVVARARIDDLHTLLGDPSRTVHAILPASGSDEVLVIFAPSTFFEMWRAKLLGLVQSREAMMQPVPAYLSADRAAIENVSARVGGAVIDREKRDDG